jgi:hypothetical protein
VIPLQHTPGQISDVGNEWSYRHVDTSSADSIVQSPAPDIGKNTNLVLVALTRGTAGERMHKMLSIVTSLMAVYFPF